MNQKFDKHLFYTGTTNVDNIVRNLEPALEASKVLRVCYPKLEKGYRKTDEVAARIKRAKYLIQVCRMGFPTVPPIVLKDFYTFWDGVDSVWIPWTFREFAAGRLPIMGGTYSRDIDAYEFSVIMTVPIRVIYPHESYFENENKAVSQKLKTVFNATFYGGEVD